VAPPTTILINKAHLSALCCKVYNSNNCAFVFCERGKRQVLHDVAGSLKIVI